jgi:DNA invertase Pin-like site-specific DNA recombinase
VTAEPRKRCIELIRVSTAAQAANDRASIPAQRAVNRDTARRHGLEIVRTVSIADVSGANVLRSPDMQELLRLIQDPAIVGVVAREFSRLMRPDNYDDLSLLQRFVDSHTDIYLPEGRVDPTDLLMTMVRAGVAGKERKEMLERAWSAKEEKRKRGELAQSLVVLPWGVEYENGNWRYKPDSAAKIRQAYRRVLRGEINYSDIAKKLGVSARGAALILQNPIWKGWRILDKKRDPSSNGKYPGKDGRQADRKKIARPESEIIRVQVIKQPLLSENEWNRAQEIMGRKRTQHWRSRSDYVSRFVYRGFLTCAACGEPVHSANQRGDVYVCRARRLAPHVCQTQYMKREQLEARLDALFAHRLTNRKFVARCIAQLRREHERQAGRQDVARLESAVERLSAKRTRILDAYLEGVLTPEERTTRLSAVEQDLAVARKELSAIATAPNAEMVPSDIVSMLAPLAEWKSWNHAQKRRVLAQMSPDIRVANGRCVRVGLSVGSYNATRRDTDSWRPPT